MKGWSIVCLVLYTTLEALPTGMEVQAGSASLKSDLAQLSVEASGKTILQWEAFDVLSHEKLCFIQAASSKDAILNRVIGGSLSQILGGIESNCPIYLVNPKGILIGNSATLKTGGFVASTADFSNEEFLAGGVLLADKVTDKAIINLGKISTDTGDIVLIARSVVNEGVLEAPQGTVLMGTSEMLLYPDTKESIFIRPDKVDMGGIEHTGSIEAAHVYMSTQSICEKAICQTGRIDAGNMVESNGRVYLTADAGGVFVGGSTICPSGEISIQAKQIEISSSAVLDVSGPSAGQILIGKIETTETLDIESGASLLANATEGDGGKIFALAKLKNYFHGKAEAKALGDVGDGGFIEISALDDLWLTSHPDLRSQAGKDGLLLCDPGSVTIEAFPGSGNPGTFTDAFCIMQLGMSSFGISTATDGVMGLEILTVNGTADMGGAANVTWNNGNSFTLTGRDSVVLHAGAQIYCMGSGGVTINGGLFPMPAVGVYDGIDVQGATVKTTDGALNLNGYPGSMGGDGIVISGNSGNAALVQSGLGNIVINALGIVVAGGSGLNEFAEISTSGGQILIDGAGSLSLSGNTAANTYAQIITGGTAPVDSILIGQMTPLTDISCSGGSGSNSWARIRADQGGNIRSTITNNYQMTGGTSPDNGHAGMYVGANQGDIVLEGVQCILQGGGSTPFYAQGKAELFSEIAGDIRIDLTGSCSLTAGNVGMGDVSALIIAGIVTINCEGDLSLTGFGGGSADAYAWIIGNQLFLDTQGSDLLLTGGSDPSFGSKYAALTTGDLLWSGRNCILQGGQNSGGAFIQASYNVQMNALGNISLLGDDESDVFIFSFFGDAALAAQGDFRMISHNEYCRAFIKCNNLGMDVGGDFLMQGGDNTITDSKNYIHATDVHINVGGDFSILGGIGYEGYAELIVNSLDCSVLGDCYLIGGDYNDMGNFGSNSYALIEASQNIDFSCRNLTLQGGGGLQTQNTLNSASIEAQGNINLSASGNIVVEGGGATKSYAGIFTTMGGNLQINSVDISFTGGNANDNATAGIATWQGGDIVCSGRDFFIQGGSASVGTYGGEAGFHSGQYGGSGDITLSGREIYLVGGPSGAVSNVATIAASSNGGSIQIQADLLSLTAGGGSNANAEIKTQGAGTISLLGGSVIMNGSSTTGQHAYIQTLAASSNIVSNLSGAVSILGGSQVNTGSLIECVVGGNLNLQVGSLQIVGGTVANVGDTGIRTASGDINIACLGNCVSSAPVADTSQAVIQTFGSNLTITTGGSIFLSGFTVVSTPMVGGRLALIAGQDISIDAVAQVTALSPSGSLTMVVDNNFPNPPDMGPGRFLLYPGATVSAGTVGSPAPVKIYTAQVSQNSVNELINGAAFTAGPLFINSSSEQWGIYFNGGVYGGNLFKFYYKNYGIIPSGISMFYGGIAANLTALADLLPVLKSSRAPGRFPNYHFALCNGKREDDPAVCDPIFSPYGSFIFEDDVYWINPN